MRNLILAVAGSAALVLSVAGAEAMPSIDSAATATAGVPHVEKTVVIVRRTVIRRPARRVCTTRVGAMGRVTKVCRSVY